MILCIKPIIALDRSKEKQTLIYRQLVAIVGVKLKAKNQFIEVFDKRKRKKKQRRSYKKSSKSIIKFVIFFFFTFLFLKQKFVTPLLGR